MEKPNEKLLDSFKIHIKTKVYDGGGIDCLEDSCPFMRECANHTTAGDYRSEDGFTPDLHREGGVFFCKTKNQSARVHYPGFPSEINGTGSLVLKDGDLVVYHGNTEEIW
jgi:hypothetical protein